MLASSLSIHADETDYHYGFVLTCGKTVYRSFDHELSADELLEWADFFEGSMPIELPQWTITGEEEEQSGYRCKVAKGTYLGREWTLWFTEEIPVNIGPWLIWGTPGLVVYAEDSENILKFRLLGIERIESSRMEKNLSYLKTRESRPMAKVYTMPMKEMEAMHTRYMRDVTYFNRIHGITGGYTEDRNGNRTEMQLTRPYIPYIADGYWTGK